MASGVRRRQSEITAVLPHLFLLVGQNAETRKWLAGAKQYETGISILRVIAGGIGLIDVAAVQQASGAGEASSLMAEGGQLDPRGRGSIPDVLIGANKDGAFPVRQ
jgi:hypothetical protein